MKFESTKEKFLGQWEFKIQFTNFRILTALNNWLGSFATDTDYEIIGDTFYTNSLQDAFAMRIQFDNQIKVIKRVGRPSVAVQD